MIVLQFVGHLFGGSMVGVNGDLLQEGLCHRLGDQGSWTQSPCPWGNHCWPTIPPQETLKHSSGSVSVGFLSSAVCKVFFEPSKCHWRVWDLILNEISPLLLSCLVFSFALGHGISFFGGIQHSPVDGCSAPSCNFGLLPGNLRPDSHNTEWSFPRDILVPGKIESRWGKQPHCKKQLDGITNWMDMSLSKHGCWWQIGRLIG